MRSLIQSIQQHLAAGRQRRESEQFSKDLLRFITQPGKAFTLGAASINPKDIRFQVPEKLELTAVPGNYGVAEIFLPCTIGNFEYSHDRPLFWLHVKTVDTMISNVFITETRPYAAPDQLTNADASTDPEPLEDDSIESSDAPR